MMRIILDRPQVEYVRNCDANFWENHASTELEKSASIYN